jgi:hypothetical protein
VTHDPDLPLLVLKDGVYGLSIQVPDRALVYPVNQPSRRSNPEASVPGAKHNTDIVGRQRFSSQRTQRNELDAIESKHSRSRSYPKIPICRLCDGPWLASEISVLDSPRGMAILRDSVGRIESSHPTLKRKKESHK